MTGTSLFGSVTSGSGSGDGDDDDDDGSADEDEMAMNVDTIAEAPTSAAAAAVAPSSGPKTKSSSSRRPSHPLPRQSTRATKSDREGRRSKHSSYNYRTSNGTTLIPPALPSSSFNGVETLAGLSRRADPPSSHSVRNSTDSIQYKPLPEIITPSMLSALMLRMRTKRNEDLSHPDDGRNVGENEWLVRVD
jgi:hypothetical protein